MPGPISDRLRATASVLTGPSLYYQTVGAISKYPAVLPEIIAKAALKYHREVKSAQFRINPTTDLVEILCPVTNVTSATIGARVPVGRIGWSSAPGGIPPSYASAETDGQIGPHSDGKLFAAMFTPSTKVRGLRLRVFLDLGPGNGTIQEFKDDLFLDF